MIISRQTQYGCQAGVACVQKWSHCRLNVANLFLVDIQTDFAMLSLAFSTLSICCLEKVVDLWRTQSKKTKPPKCNIPSTGWRLFDIAWKLSFSVFFLYQDIWGPSKQGATHLEQPDANLFLGGTFQLSSDQDPTLSQLNLARSDLSIHFSRPLASSSPRANNPNNCCSRLLHNWKPEP